MVSIKEVNSEQELATLETAWTNFLTNCNHSVFATWPWIATWWKHFGNGRKLKLLIAQENNEIVGIAPLMYSVESMFGVRRGKLEFIGMPDADYNSFIVRRDQNQQEIFDAFMDHLNNNSTEKWVFLNLKDMPENPECSDAIQKRAKLQQATQCAYLPLPNSYEAFLKSLSYKQRGNVNNTMNKIKKNFSAELADYSSPTLCNEGLQHLILLHQKRWASVGLTGAFSNQQVQRFHFDIAQEFAKRDMLGLYLLKFDGKPVSGSYGFKHGAKYYAYLPGYDPEYAKFGVGFILIPYLVEEFIRKGLKEFDLMRGDEGYKQRWNAILRWNCQTTLTRKGYLGKFRHRLYEFYWKQGNRIKFVFHINI